MYVRTTSRTNKDKSVTKYVQLAHNIRNPKTGSPQAEVLYNFGRMDQLDMDVLRRLSNSIQRFLGEEPAPSAGKVAELKLLSSRPMGGAWFLDHLWHTIGIDSILKQCLKDRQYRIEVERAIFAMVANRALAPSSKLQLEAWVPDKVFISGLQCLDVQHCYRAMDFLLESKDEIERGVFNAVADLFNLEVDLLFFDTTSTYFEMDEWDDDKQDLKALGHTKDNRPDLPQIVIGLAVTRDGIPIRSWVWPGDTSDMTVIPEVKRDLTDWKLGRVITVVDRGFSSKENLRILQQAGGHYIAGERLTPGKPEVEQALSHPGRFRTIRENLEVKEVIVGNGEARIRYVLVRNPSEAKRDAHTRNKHLERLKEKLAKLKELDGDAHTKAHCRLYSHIVYKKYLKIDAKGNLKINDKAVKEAEKLDGKYLIRTSDDTLSVEDIALGYKQLWEVERAFRTLKTTLELRPVYHRKDDRICSHVLLCWLALLLVRLAEVKTKQTWSMLRSELEKIHLIERESVDGKVFQRTELTKEQTGIFSAMKLPEPPRILDISLKQGLKT